MAKLAAPSTRLSEDFKNGPESRVGTLLVAQALKEQQGIDDLVTREGIDDEPLLVGGDHFLRGGVDVEDAFVEQHNILNERNFVLKPSLGDDALGLAEFEHDRLLSLADRKQSQVADEGRECEDDEADGKSGAAHWGWPSGAGGRLESSGSGR